MNRHTTLTLAATLTGGEWAGPVMLKTAGEAGEAGDVKTQASVDRECPTCLQRHLSNIL